MADDAIIIDDASSGNRPPEFDGLVIIDPAEIGGTGPAAGAGGSGGSGTGDTPKRRGRKPGSGGGSRKAATNLDINGVEALLLSIHTMGAAMLKVPELAIDKQEAHALAVATANVSRHYNVAVAAKTMDWMHLFGALGMVYIPRVIAINARSKANRGQRPAQERPAPRRETANGAAEKNGANTAFVPGVGTVDLDTGQVIKGESIN